MRDVGVVSFAQAPSRRRVAPEHQPARVPEPVNRRLAVRQAPAHTNRPRQLGELACRARRDHVAWPDYRGQVAEREVGGGRRTIVHLKRRPRCGEAAPVEFVRLARRNA